MSLLFHLCIPSYHNQVFDFTYVVKKENMDLVLQPDLSLPFAWPVGWFQELKIDQQCLQYYDYVKIFYSSDT